MIEDKCVFCEIVAGREPCRLVKAWKDAIAIVPLNPVVDGHVIVIPMTHVKDATQSPQLTGKMMKHAAELARERGQCNIITSVGKDATQSVFHLHIHVVPRMTGDGLKLPWSK